MYALNEVKLIGNIGNIDTHNTGDMVITSFSVATDESYKDKSGQKIERVEWHKCVGFRKVGEILAQYASKGTKIFVSGKLQTRKYEKDGIERSSTEIIVNDFILLGGKQTASDYSAPAQEDDFGF